MPGTGKPKGRKLAEYRRKRSVEGTPEPWGGTRGERPGLFVIHKHAARRLHFDLRLEMEGVLQSWAVPKGPSLDPSEKRLAVLVEEHPIEYADFEGVIPKDSYGAGAMIVWDRGRWVPHGDPVAGLAKGKLLFDLHGYKLQGRWTLFRTGRGGRDWLLVKKPDGFARAGDDDLPQPSILSGLTVEALGSGRDPAAAMRRRLARTGAPAGEVDPATVEPMLAATADAPFTREGWIFEIKYDGYRLVAALRDGRPYLRYRRGEDVTARFPECAGALARLPWRELVIDAELVALDDRGHPSFGRLQRRARLTSPREIERAMVAQPVTLVVFDLLALEGYDLRPLPLLARKKILRAILPPAGPMRYSDHIATRGEAMYEQVVAMGLEGCVAKKADTPYRSGRSGDWLKIRADRTDDFAIVGFTRSSGARTGFGALHLAAMRDGALVYAGRVGTGFKTAEADRLAEALEASRRVDPACTGAVPRGDDHVWVDPAHVCEVRYKEITGDGMLRHPVWLRLRDDRSVAECVFPAAAGADPEPLAPIDPVEVEARPEPEITNRDKVFWPAEGYTKGDLIAYYRGVSPWLLPWLEDRPVVLTRYPDGIEGKSFFQKDAPAWVPDWIRTESMWSEHAQREIHYFICHDERTLAFLANLGTIPLHVWSSRVATLQSPDWCILDLDPKTAPFTDVVRIALAIRSLCDAIDLPAYVKTSGATGLHILVPLGRQSTYEWSRTLGQLLAEIVVLETPGIATTARSVAARRGRVYIDYLQNGHGRLLVGPYSVRPLPGAPVSTPLRWSEVTRRLDVTRFTIRTLPRRLARLKEDPCLGALTDVPDLEGALRRLEARQRPAKGRGRRRA